MPTFREDLHLGHEVALVETDDIRDGAITSEKLALQVILTNLIADLAVTSAKLADLSVTTPKIAELAVVTSKLADLSVTTAKVAEQAITTEKIHDLAVITEKLADLAVTTGKIADLAVTTDKLASESVTNDKIHNLTISWQKLDNDLQNIIASAGQHGVALSNEWGNSTLIGLTQKMLSEALGEVHKEDGNFISLQQQIDQIVSGQATVSLTANKSAIFVGEDTQVSLTATTDTDASQIKIYKGDVHIGTGSGPRSYTTTSREIPQSAGNITYRAEFTIAGLVKQATKIITAVYPIYYGAGTSYAETTMVADTVPHIAGSFTKQITTADGDYLFIEVPDNFNLTSIKLVSTYETSLGFTQIESTRAGYKAYKNNDARGAGTYTYKFTIANA